MVKVILYRRGWDVFLKGRNENGTWITRRYLLSDAVEGPTPLRQAIADCESNGWSWRVVDEAFPSDFTGLHPWDPNKNPTGDGPEVALPPEPEEPPTGDGGGCHWFCPTCGEWERLGERCGCDLLWVENRRQMPHYARFGDVPTVEAWRRRIARRISRPEGQSPG